MQPLLPQEAEADEGAGEMQEGEDGGGLTMEAHGQTAEGKDPRIRPFDRPAVATEPLAGLDTATGDPGYDPAPPQSLPADGKIVAFVAVELGWAEARSAGLTNRAANRRDRIDQWLQELGVMHVGRGQQHGQGDTLPIYPQMELAARFAPIHRTRAGRLAAAFGSNTGAVQAGSRPVDLAEIARPVQQGAVHPGPDAQCLPLA